MDSDSSLIIFMIILQIYVTSRYIPLLLSKKSDFISYSAQSVDRYPRKFRNIFEFYSVQEPIRVLAITTVVDSGVRTIIELRDEDNSII